MESGFFEYLSVWHSLDITTGDKTMDLGLKGKTALVTGASEGIGKAIAWKLAEEGVRVAICARTVATLQETAAAITHATGMEIGRASCRERVCYVV